MRSFSGRDILSLKGFEREEYFRVFQVAEALAPRVLLEKLVSGAEAQRADVQPPFTSRRPVPGWRPKRRCTDSAGTSLVSRMPR